MKFIIFRNDFQKTGSLKSFKKLYIPLNLGLPKYFHFENARTKSHTKGYPQKITEYITYIEEKAAPFLASLRFKVLFEFILTLSP